MRSWIRQFWRENRTLFIFVLLMVCFRSALADWNTVPTGSMNPTIIAGDRVWVNKLAYDIRIPFTGISLKRLSNPVRGDIVTFDSKAADLTLIKRVIGLPGDTVEMNRNRLTVNGRPAGYRVIGEKGNKLLVEEDLGGMKHMIIISQQPTFFSSFAPVTVPADMYLVLGDNRDNSADSRVHGFIPRDEIRGRSRQVILSLDYDHFYFPRTTRFFKELI
ncbi:MAG: signal peptidase I [bacterium]